MSSREPRFKNVFVLGTGRCGTVSFIRACQHIDNYSAGHETRCGMVGEQRMAYPKNHIEADNRLAWFLGRLDRQFGDAALYVHLQRDLEETAKSFANRYSRGVMHGYRTSILWNMPRCTEPMHVCKDYVETVTSNIEHFLRDKPYQMKIQLEDAKAGLENFWEAIGATGDLMAARRDLVVRHNATSKPFSVQRLAEVAVGIRNRFVR